MKQNLSWVIGAVVLFGCATAHFDRDRGNPSYIRPIPEVGGLPQAAMGVVASALSLVANPEYYRDSFITGRCLCRASDDAGLEIPCTNVGIQLVDNLGKEIRKLHTSDGEFIFPAEKDRVYELRVRSRNFTILSAPKSVKMGDDVIIHLQSSHSS